MLKKLENGSRNDNFVLFVPLSSISVSNQKGDVRFLVGETRNQNFTNFAHKFCTFFLPVLICDSRVSKDRHIFKKTCPEYCLNLELHKFASFS